MCSPGWKLQFKTVELHSVWKTHSFVALAPALLLLSTSLDDPLQLEHLQALLCSADASQILAPKKT